MKIVDCTIAELQQGRVSLADPEQQHTYEERAAIMEHEGSIAREEETRQAWCQTACMISFPSQWRECERFKLKPCLTSVANKIA